MATKLGRYVPERGDLIWLSFDPRAGHEQAGRRPAVVISPASYNGKTHLAICCPITSSKKGYPFEVPVPADLPIRGVILSDQLKSLDWHARQAEFIVALPKDALREVLRKAVVLVAIGA